MHLILFSGILIALGTGLLTAVIVGGQSHGRKYVIPAFRLSGEIFDR